jgi:hypothetical protein
MTQSARTHVSRGTKSGRWFARIMRLPHRPCDLLSLTTMTTPYEVVTSFMQKNSIPGLLLFAMVTGRYSTPPYHNHTQKHTP